MFAASGIIYRVFILSFGNFVYRDQAGAELQANRGSKTVWN